MMLAAALAGCALAAEIAAAALGIHLEASFYMSDPDRGWAFRPGAHGWNVNEGRVYVRINSDGMRDREHARSKPAGAYRIAVLGDSFTAALNVPQEDTFWSLLETTLSGCAAFAGTSIEALDFGVGGYGTAQELITLQTHVWQYDPDLVLLAFYPGNDVLNNERRLNPNDGDQAPYFVQQNDALVPDNSFRAHVLLDPARLRLRNIYADLMNRSELLLTLAALRRSLLRAKTTITDSRPNPEATLVPFAPPHDEVMDTAWRVTEKLLMTLRGEVAAHGAALRIVSLTAPEQVDPQIEHRAAWMQTVGVQDLYYQERRLRGFAAANGLRLQTLAPAMADRAARTGELFHVNGTGHWNAVGHRAAADLIAADLCAAAPR